MIRFILKTAIIAGLSVPALAQEAPTAPAAPMDHAMAPAAPAAPMDHAMAPAAPAAPMDHAMAPAAPLADVVTGVITAPPAGKGQVVFFRKGGWFGAAISCAVHENGVKLSSLSPGHYTVVVAEPGIHSYSVKSEATDTLRLEVEAGETYFSQCTISIGVVAGRPNLSPDTRDNFAKLAPKLKPVVQK